MIDRYDDLVLVVDRNMVLHLLGCDDGRYRASIALTAAFRQDPNGVGGVELVTMPSIEGESLIVVTNRGVVAYRIAEFLERP